MAADREHPADLSDAQLEQLLKLAYDAPEPDEAYVEALSRKLDREFTRSPELPAHLEYDQIPSNNGIAKASETRASTNSSKPTLQTNPKPQPLQRETHRSKWRIAILLTTAASLLVAAALWNSPPAYGWAAMIKALEQCSWVQTLATDSGVNGWASAPQGVVAAQAGNRMVYRDDRQAMGTDYHADEQVAYQKSLESRQATSWETRLLVLLLSDSSEIEAILHSAPQGWQLVSESWKQVEGNAEFHNLIQLRVKLRALDSDNKTIELEFLLNPLTQLPISGRVVNEAPHEDTSFEFAYPEQGPTTIFALGIPQETKFIASPENESVSAQTELLGQNSANDLAKPRTNPPASNSTTSPHEPADWTVVAEPIPPDQLAEQLNTMLTTYWESQRVPRTQPASDTEFLRRVYLDLTGRIPMVSEVYHFLEDTSPDRRERLVHELLAGRDHATHLAAVWRTMLLPNGVDLQTLGGTAKFDEWLAERFGKNLPYDQLVSQLLSAEGRVSESGPLLFYAALKLNPEELAAKTSRVFLGTRMECAQCHDHPFDNEISQEDFWGFAAFFAQISRPKGKMEVTSPVLRVRDNTRGEVQLPHSDETIEPRLPITKQNESLAEDQQALSRRQQLIAWLTARNNQRFATATVNRVWEHLFGRGLVDPVDDLRIDNPPAIPEVLELLSQNFAASGFDLRQLMRTLVLSEAYQLSSQAAVDEPSQTLLFARMNMKSMTADQLYDCIAVATQNEAMLLDSMENGALTRLNNTPRQAFITQFQSPPGQRTNFHAGIPQALTLLHGQIIHGSTDLATSGLLKSLAAPFFSDQQRIETLFLATLSRLPNEEEQEQMIQHILATKNESERMQAMGNILWALLNSAEFTFIH